MIKVDKKELENLFCYLECKVEDCYRKEVSQAIRGFLANVEVVSPITRKKEINISLEDKLLLTPEEVQPYLGVGKSTLYDVLLKDNTFPKLKIGTRHYINKDKLQEWINKQCK